MYCQLPAARSHRADLRAGTTFLARLKRWQQATRRVVEKIGGNQSNHPPTDRHSRVLFGKSTLGMDKCHHRFSNNGAIPTTSRSRGQVTPEVKAIQESERTGERIGQVTLWVNKISYPLTLLAMFTVVIALGHCCRKTLSWIRSIPIRSIPIRSPGTIHMRPIDLRHQGRIKSCSDH